MFMRVSIPKTHYKVFTWFLLIVWFCFFFRLCLLVFSFAFYFWWMGSHPWFLFIGFFFVDLSIFKVKFTPQGIGKGIIDLQTNPIIIWFNIIQWD
jgi:hypothetical protein